MELESGGYKQSMGNRDLELESMDEGLEKLHKELEEQELQHSQKIDVDCRDQGWGCREQVRDCREPVLDYREQGWDCKAQELD